MEKIKMTDLFLMLAVGDGVIAAAFPRQHAQAWSGKTPFGQMSRWFANHPGACRAAGIAEASLGLLWASRIYSRRRLQGPA